MDIFLTGHNGFIGKHLHRKLLLYNHRVFTGLEQLYIRPYDVVIHLAAVTHIRPEFDPKIFESNIVLSSKVMATPYRTIYASSCSAAHLTNPYAYTKRYTEWLGENHPNALGFRFFNVYGPGNNKGIVWALDQKKDGDTMVIRGPELIRDYVYVDDVVSEIVINLKGYIVKNEDRPTLSIGAIKNIGLHDLGTGKGTTTLELVEEYQRITKKKFQLLFEEAGENEPKEMVSKRIIPHTRLTAGLTKHLRHHG